MGASQINGDGEGTSLRSPTQELSLHGVSGRMIASARFFYLIIIANTRLLALALPSIISFFLWKLFAITAFMGSGNKGYGLLGLKSDVVAFTEASQNGDTERREDVLCMAFVMYFYPVLLTASAAASIHRPSNERVLPCRLQNLLFEIENQLCQKKDVSPRL